MQRSTKRWMPFLVGLLSYALLVPIAVGADQATAVFEIEGMTDAELSRVVSFVVDRLIGAGDAVGHISREDIEAGTGVGLPDSAGGVVQAAVIAKMQEDHPVVLAKLEGGSRCAEYGACSLHGNLAGAR